MTDQEQTPLSDEVAEAAELPFSHLYPVERLPGEGRVVKMAVDTDDRSRIASHLGLDGLSSLTAKVTLKPFAGGEMVRVTGTLVAHVIQTCGITLQPVESDVEETVERVFSFQAADDSDAKELDLDPEAAEPPDPVIEGHIDLGDVLVEQLALGIDPFPRLPGAEFSVPKGADGASSSSPFAVLEGLKAGKSLKS